MADGLRGFQCEQNRNALTTLSGITNGGKRERVRRGASPCRAGVLRGETPGDGPRCADARANAWGGETGPGNAAFSFVNAITARDAPLCERTGEDAVQPAPAPPGSAGRGREEALARESAFTGASLAAR